MRIAGTVGVNLTGRVSATTTYTILTSANTTGTFGSVSMSNSAYARNARLSYSGNNVLLTLDPGLLSPSLPGFANINQKNVAAGIDSALLAGGSMTTGVPVRCLRICIVKAASLSASVAQTIGSLAPSQSYGSLRKASATSIVQ